jgi:hypothetical protein
MHSRFAERRKARRQTRELNKVMREASPSMRQELIAAAARDFSR